MDIKNIKSFQFLNKKLIKPLVYLDSATLLKNQKWL